MWTSACSGPGRSRRIRTFVSECAAVCVMSTSSGTALDGRYLVEERLAEGGHSVVYRGRDLRLDAAVAIKVLKDRADVDSFRREARLARQFEHPHAVRVLDFGPAPGDRVTAPYLVMEYVHGETLKALSRQLTGEQIRRFVSEIGGTLAFAHRRGLAHRDFKPQNVLLETARSGRGERFVLIDFGIATQFDGTRSLQNHDADGLGTAPYMSPEQWRGQGDHRADIYAFGCVLFELLAETVPFPADGFRGGLTDYIEHVTRSPAPRLRAAAPLCPVNDSIEGLLAACLEKSPLARPSDLEPIIARFLAEFDPPAFDRYRASRHRILGDIPPESWESRATTCNQPPGSATGHANIQANGQVPEADIRFHCQTVVVPEASTTEPVRDGFRDDAGAGTAVSPSGGGRDTHKVGGNTVKSGGGSVKSAAARAPVSPVTTGRDLAAAPPAEGSIPTSEHSASAADAQGVRFGGGKKPPHGATPVAWSVPLVTGAGTRSDAGVPPTPRSMESGTAVPTAVTRSGSRQSASPGQAAGLVAAPYRAARAPLRSSRRRIPWLELTAACLALIATTGLVLFHQASDQQIQSIRAAIHAAEFSRAVRQWEAITPPVAWIVDREALGRDLADGIGERWRGLLARPAWNDANRAELSELRALLRRVAPQLDTETSLVTAARERGAMIATAVSEQRFADAEDLLAADDGTWLRTELGSAFPSDSWTHARVLGDWFSHIERLDGPAQPQPLEELRHRIDAALQILRARPGSADERHKLITLREQVTTALSRLRP